MTSIGQETETLWIYAQAGAFRFLSRSGWDRLYARIVESGWEMSSAGDMGWLQSELNPYPCGAFFSEADAKSFSVAAKAFLAAESLPRETGEAALLTHAVELFDQGAILIRSQPPRKTIDTRLLEVVYAYSCRVCGFLHSGSWVFDVGELNPQHMRSSVETMLRFAYCPLCGSKDIIAVTFFLRQLDPGTGCDLMSSCQASEHECR
jgi:hypothetical protein